MASNNNKRVAESILKLTVDQRSSKQSEQRVKALEDNIKRLAKETNGFTDANKKQQRQLKTTLTALEAYDKGMSELARSGKMAVNQQEELEKSLQGVDRAYQQAGQAARSYDENSSRARTQFGAVGDVESASRTVGGAVGAFGGAGIERGVSVAAEIPAVVEALPILAGSIKDVGANAARSSSFIGTMATSIGNAVPALGVAGAGFAAIGIAVGAVVVALAPLAIAMNMVRLGSKKAAEEGKKLAEIYSDVASSTAEARLKLMEGDTEGAAGDFNNQVREYNRLALEWGETQNRIVAAQEEINRQASSGDVDMDEVRRQQTIRDELQDQQEELVTEQMSLAASIEDLVPVMRVAGVEFEGLGEGVANMRAITEDAEDEVEELTEAEQKLISSREQAQTRIDALDQQEQNLIAQREQRQQDAAEQEALAAEFAAEDAQQLADDHQEKLRDIEAEGNDKIESIRADGLDKEQTAVERGEDAIAKTRADANKQIADVNAKFMQDEIKSLDKFRKAEAKRIKQGNAERLRLLDDLNDRLLDAERQNDVIAFIQAQKAGEKDLERQAEDASEEQTEAQLAFAEERQARRQAREERIAEIRTESQERIQAQRRATREEIAAIKDATKQRIEAEQIAITTRLEAEREAEQERLAREEQRAQREAQRTALRDAQEQRSFEAQLQRIEAKRQAELNALVAVEAAAIRIAATASSIGSSSSYGRGTSPIIRTPGSRGGGGSTGFTPIAFAEGGIVSQPTFGLLGERPGYNEAIIPFRPSEGLNGVMGGTTVQVNLSGDIVVGDVASMSQVRQEVQGGLNQFGSEILSGIQGARNQPRGV